MLGSLMVILFGGWVYMSQYKHLLIMLVSLEMMALGIFWMMGVWNTLFYGEEFTLLMYLSMAACEGSLGLAILVGMVRSHGSDNFNNISILMC
uniref:NADH-ubiquinone oxidoreductase chain 4L n=1 Tax=Bothropolys sp. SP-2004 TaxID=292347 RepID=A5D6J9_9MYRI|nr:NADH dehydrogenase subunit 4L [Bothropolys sp. SP-2004]